MFANKKRDSKFLSNKKAQGLPVNTLILIILGIVVLVVLIIGFTIGWSSVKEWFTSGTSDSQRAVTECAVACSTGNKIDWCAVKYKIDKIEESCESLSIKKQIDKTDCPGIICPGSESAQSPTGTVEPQA